MSTIPTVDALPGLATLGKKTVADAAAAGIAPVPPRLDLSGAAYSALDHLPEGVTVAQVKADAHALAMNPSLSQLSFLHWIRDYEVDETPGVDQMLTSIRARNAGEAGRRVVMITSRCHDFGKRIPKPDPRFVERFQKGLATAGEVLNVVKWLAGELDKVRRGYEDMLPLVDEEEAYHLSQSNLSIEATARDLVIAGEENERADKLIRVVALLECLEPESAKRLTEDLSEADRARIQGVAILVTARIKNLKPMIAKANLAVKRFSAQSTSNGLTALDQYDFATAGIAAWKVDIAGQLDAVANIAMNMAYLEGVKFTDEQARATADAFDAQMQSMADVLTTQLNSLSTIEYVTASLEKAGEIMTSALQTVHDQNKEAAVVIEQSLQGVKAAEQKMNAETTRILGS